MALVQASVLAGELAAAMSAMTRWPMRTLLERQFAKAGDIVLPDYAFAG